MKEGEAREKWCPFARCGKATSNAALNRGNDREGQVAVGSLCIASDCMAWRRYSIEIPAPDKPAGSVRLPDDPAYFEEHGYCGLAGGK